MGYGDVGDVYDGEELLPSQIINTFDRDKILRRIYCRNFQPCVQARKAILLESRVPYL
jgi:hypothetical protein